MSVGGISRPCFHLPVPFDAGVGLGCMWSGCDPELSACTDVLTLQAGYVTGHQEQGEPAVDFVELLLPTSQLSSLLLH